MTTKQESLKRVYAMLSDEYLTPELKATLEKATVKQLNQISDWLELSIDLAVKGATKRLKQ